MTLIRAYLSLAERPRRVIRNKRIELKATPQRALDLLRSIGELDRVNDEQRDRLNLQAWVFFILALLGIVAVNNLPVGPVGYVVPALFFVLAGAIKFAHYFFRNRDLPNNLRLFVLPLVAVLREDMDETERMTLNVDLRGAKDKSKLQNEETRRPGGRVVKVDESSYRDPWLEGSARLADGVLLKWRIVDSIRHRSVTKRNARGKTKWKSKEKIRRLTEIQLVVPRKRYEVVPTIDEQLLGIRGAVVRKVAKDGKEAIRIRHVETLRDADAPAKLRPFLRIIAAVYQKALTVPQGDGGAKGRD